MPSQSRLEKGVSRSSTEPPGPVCRVDSFEVPAAAMSEFLAKVRATHDCLRSQPGFLQDVILVRMEAPGLLSLMTVVTWRSRDVLPQVGAAVAALHAGLGFDPAEVMARLHIVKRIDLFDDITGGDQHSRDEAL